MFVGLIVKFCAFIDMERWRLLCFKIWWNWPKIEELLEIGGTQILFQGGVHPK